MTEEYNFIKGDGLCGFYSHYSMFKGKDGNFAQQVDMSDTVQRDSFIAHLMLYEPDFTGSLRLKPTIYHKYFGYRTIAFLLQALDYKIL
jgi:hypothetical protein